MSVHHGYDRKVKNHIPPEYNIITAWVEVRDSSLLYAYQRQFDPRYTLRNLGANKVNAVHSLLLAISI